MSGEEIDVALAEPAELSQEAREHLAGCPECRDQVELLTAKLDILGRLAREYAPESRNRFALPPDRKRHEFFSGRPLALAGGGVLALVFLAVLGLNIWGTGNGIEPSQTLLSEHIELSSVKAELVEAAPISPFHNFVLGQSTAVINDEFLKFVSEPLENI